MEQIRRILQDHFGKVIWEITPPSDGQRKVCYIARSAQLTVFIKLHAPIAALQRLGEIAIAPRVLASGIDAGTPYVVQEYIANAHYPRWQWYARHLPLLATFMRRYHYDKQLTYLLSSGTNRDYYEHIAADLARLEAQFIALPGENLHTPEIHAAFSELKNRAHTLQSSQLVPVHADPNTKNMLLTERGLLMVDWDEIQLSDPLQDSGLLLWWYVAQRQWPDFFQSYGWHMDKPLVERIFWWAARTSFAIALWHVEHHYDCTAFVQDFMAAIAHKSNPHAVFEDH